MNAGIVMIIMFLMLALGFPIFVAMGVAGVLGFISTSAQVTLFLNVAYTGLDSFPLMAVPFFILAGKLMEEGGISKRLVNLINFFIGRIAGALAIVGIVTCALFGAVSGSAIATSVSVGGIVMPGMEKDGYDPAFSAGLMGVAGTIGALIPPSMTFIIYGALTGTSIGDMFIAGVIPGVLLTVALCVTAYFICKKRGYYGERNVNRSPKEFLRLFKEAFWALMVPFIILGGIYGGIFTPTEAGVVACVYAVIAACFIYKTLNLKGLYNAIAEAGRLCVVTMIICSFASGLARYLTMVNVPQTLSRILAAASGNSTIVFLLLVTVFMLILGCIMDTTPAVIVLAPILHPIAMNFGVHPIHFGMIMSLSLLVGLATPPVGANLYVMSSMTKIPFMKIARQMVPFLATTIAVLLLIVFFPILSTVFVR